MPNSKSYLIATKLILLYNNGKFDPKVMEQALAELFPENPDDYSLDPIEQFIGSLLFRHFYGEVVSKVADKAVNSFTDSLIQSLLEAIEQNKKSKLN